VSVALAVHFSGGNRDTGFAAIFSQGKDNTVNSGSGSVIHRDGYILTNDHVVQDRPGIVLLRDQPPLPYRTIGRLWEIDLVMINFPDDADQ